MTQKTKAKQLLDNPLLAELFEEYQKRLFVRFMSGNLEGIADMHADAKASMRCLAYIENKCKEIISDGE